MKFFYLQGRMRRRDFALAFFGWLILIAIIGVTEKKTQIDLTALTIVVFAALIPPMVRRLHDLRYSGWLVIGVIMIPITALLLLTVGGEQAANQYGPNPKDKSSPANPGGRSSGAAGG